MVVIFTILLRGCLSWRFVVRGWWRWPILFPLTSRFLLKGRRDTAVTADHGAGNSPLSKRLSDVTGADIAAIGDFVAPVVVDCTTSFGAGVPEDVVKKPEDSGSVGASWDPVVVGKFTTGTRPGT